MKAESTGRSSILGLRIETWTHDDLRFMRTGLALTYVALKDLTPLSQSPILWIVERLRCTNHSIGSGVKVVSADNLSGEFVLLCRAFVGAQAQAEGD